MKTEIELRQEFDDNLATLREPARRDRRTKYFATRSHFPNKTAAEILNGIRSSEKWVTEYKKYSSWNPQWSPESSRRKCRIVESEKDAGLRFVGYADELTRIDHQGWYCTAHSDFSEVFRGAVWQLPARNGKAQYLAGYKEPWSGGVVLDMEIIEGLRGYYQDGWCDTDDQLIQAARDADSFAQFMAEANKEADLEYQAEQRAEELREEASEIRSNLCDTIREEREKIAEKLAEAQDFIDNPWQLSS